MDAKGEKSMIPLYGFLEGDVIGVVVLADESDTIEVLIRKLQASAAVRLKPKANVKLIHKGRPISGETTVLQARMEPLDRIDVVGGTTR